MDIKEAAKAFINCHKPSKIDVNYICQNYGSIECYVNFLSNQIEEYKPFDMYLEISGSDTLSGNPVIIEWEVD
tara:strand:+ start:270 stop:488 length:219 start_codon:yes stop_codon:yes gene_type:complete